MTRIEMGLQPNHSILLTAASFGWTVKAAAADRLR